MMVTLHAEVEGQRVDQFLSEVLPQLSRSAAQRLLEEGRAFSHGKVLKKNYRLQAGEEVVLTIPDPEPPAHLLPQAIPLDVRYEDEDVIVVNKPVGMVVHPAPGHPDGTLVNALLYHCGESLSGINGSLRPGIVHRIDRDTSGLIIAAKNDAAHVSLAEQLKDHSLHRIYEAVVAGGLREDRGAIELPIARHPTERKKMAVNHWEGRWALTHWEVLHRFAGYTHVQCRLATGRTHQIRVHFSAIGHPVLGDPVYGGIRKGFPGLNGQCLHAQALHFRHPRSGKRVEVVCPLPEYFSAVLTKCASFR